MRFGDPVDQAIYPHMARLWAEGQIAQFRRTIIRVGVLCGLGGIAIWLGFLLLGQWVLGLTVGREYISAYEIMLIYMLGINLYMFGIAFRAAVLSMGHPERSLQIHIISTLIYLGTLALLLGSFELIGAAIAYIVHHSYIVCCNVHKYMALPGPEGVLIGPAAGNLESFQDLDS